MFLGFIFIVVSRRPVEFTFCHDAHQVQSDIKRMQISDNHASVFSQLDLCTFKDLLNSLAKYVREDTTVEVFLLTETL